MEKARLLFILLAILCLRHDCMAQPRAFDAGDLIIRDDQGNVVKDLRESPCWQEIGYNPGLSRQAILDEYSYCESEKRKKLIFTVVGILFVVGFLGIILRSAISRAKPKAGL